MRRLPRRSWSVGLAMAGLALACHVTDPEDSGGVMPGDRDGDGVLDGDDCAPDDVGIYPGAYDGCDGVDNDCDTEVDEDVPRARYFSDHDGDGYGDPGEWVEQCVPPDGYVSDGLDCGPGDPTIYPGAPEHCDGLDHDCDGVTMEADSVDPFKWYPDADGDGYGADTDPTLSCAQPIGFVGNVDDCDDTRADVSPSAPEVCDDADVDEDCDHACNEMDAWWAGGSAWWPDLDHDGYGDPGGGPEWHCEAPFGWVDNELDCDDSAREVSPAAIESCNDLDDDCDGVIDDDAGDVPADAPSWYADLDGDGYGDPASARSACAQPSSYVAASGDCNDRREDVYPGAPEADCSDALDYNCDGSASGADADLDGYPSCEDCDDADAAVNAGAAEVCNGIDDDCDGAVDEDEPEPWTTWYLDADGDGFGSIASSFDACTAPAGHVSNLFDCDDLDAAVHPGAVEDCATASDDDCDGSFDATWAYGCTPFYRDQDGDGFGAESTCACEPGPIYTTAAGGDCDDADPDRSPGASEICEDGIDQDCQCGDDPCTLEAASARVLGASEGEATGAALAAGGDVDGDGVEDAWVAAPGWSGTGTEVGRVGLFAGPLGGDLTWDGGAVGTWVGTNAGGAFGATLLGGHDLDADGLADLVVGAPDADYASSSEGVAYLYTGVPGDGVGTEAAEAWVYGATGFDHAGSALGLLERRPDDGRPALAVGARGVDDFGTEGGVVYLLEFPVSGARSVLTADTEIRGEPGSKSATALMVPGDLDGDGIDDLVVGAPDGTGDDPESGVVLVFSAPRAAVLAYDDADGTWNGRAADDKAGSALARAGDLDEDGLADFVAGAPAADGGGGGAGAAYVVTGPALGRTSLSDAWASISGSAPGDALGSALAGGVDIDADGRPDLVLGAPGVDEPGESCGGVYLFLDLPPGESGARDASASWPGLEEGERVGSALDVGVALDRDGGGDILVGAPGAAVDGVIAGIAYLL